MRNRGFTLLEMLVATMLMGIAVVGLLSNLSTSLRNAARLTEYDRASLLARRQMDELLLDQRLPRLTPIEGEFDSALFGERAGWRAQITPFELPPNAAPGAGILERIELEVWWMSGERRRAITLEGFRRGFLRPEDAARGAQ